MIKNITNLGDEAVYCDFGREVNEKTNLNVISYFTYIKKLSDDKKIEGINNLIPSYNKLIINFDLSITNYKKIEKELKNLKVPNSIYKNSKKIQIPICFDDEFGLDLNNISKQLNMSKNEIINAHLNKEYFCYMTGFIAGMPFLGDINEAIRINRLETPRVTVPKGSVGIAEQFCNIYTFESPGGWNIIGNTPIKVFDKLNLNSPTLVNPGDKIKFYQISKQEFLNWNE